jgi:hypothetical protein
MKEHDWSIALIPRAEGEPEHWFCLWRDDQEHYDFVTGEKDSDESLRECMDRAVRESLPLEHNDFLVSNMAQLNLEFSALLPGYATPQHVGAALFMVHLYSKRARQVIESHADGCWLTGKELRSGMALDGRPINPTLQYLLNRSEVIQPW